MVIVPAAIPDSEPAEPMVAIVAALLLHVPPATVSLNGVAEPTQTFTVPVIGPGAGFTVTVAVDAQPEPSV